MMLIQASFVLSLTEVPRMRGFLRGCSDGQSAEILGPLESRRLRAGNSLVCPVVRTQCFYCWGQGFNPWSGK